MRYFLLLAFFLYIQNITGQGIYECQKDLKDCKADLDSRDITIKNLSASNNRLSTSLAICEKKLADPNGVSGSQPSPTVVNNCQELSQQLYASQASLTQKDIKLTESQAETAAKDRQLAEGNKRFSEGSKQLQDSTKTWTSRHNTNKTIIENLQDDLKTARKQITNKDTEISTIIADKKQQLAAKDKDLSDCKAAKETLEKERNAMIRVRDSLNNSAHILANSYIWGENIHFMGDDTTLLAFEIFIPYFLTGEGNKVEKQRYKQKLYYLAHLLRKYHNQRGKPQYKIKITSYDPRLGNAQFNIDEFKKYLETEAYFEGLFIQEEINVEPNENPNGRGGFHIKIQK